MVEAERQQIKSLGKEYLLDMLQHNLDLGFNCTL